MAASVNEPDEIDFPSDRSSSTNMATTRRSKQRTITVTPNGQLVPWLAAEGPLAYTPENPPDRDYYFQYTWILPEIFSPSVNRRRHYFFAGHHRENSRELFAFWESARRGESRQLFSAFGTATTAALAAPIAVYTIPPTRYLGEKRLFVQHGSYQLIDVGDQAEVEDGMALLYRGIGEDKRFDYPSGDVRPETWRRYVNAQSHILSDSTRSFNSIHDRAARCETSHLNDRSWMTDDIGSRYGIDLQEGGADEEFWRCTTQSFTLSRRLAQWKFGPSYVVFRTPLTNIRMTTFVAGEFEVRVLDPAKMLPLEENGCRIVST